MLFNTLCDPHFLHIAIAYRELTGYSLVEENEKLPYMCMNKIQEMTTGRWLLNRGIIRWITIGDRKYVTIQPKETKPLSLSAYCGGKTSNSHILNWRYHANEY